MNGLDYIPRAHYKKRTDPEPIVTRAGALRRRCGVNIIPRAWKFLEGGWEIRKDPEAVDLGLT
jgi:hypothetical protein